MNPIFNDRVVKLEIFHKDYNIDAKHNIDELPEEPAVFGVFGIIHQTPVHPRYVSSTKNLRKSIQEAYESPINIGLKNFMQGNWIQMLCYEVLKDLNDAEIKQKEDAWIEEYKPAVKDDGEYTEYLYEWPYEDNGNLKPEYASPPLARV